MAAMTLNELRYITAVARERHFGRAAKACFVSQPTLSVAVKKLEEELGVLIFERHPNEVTLTPVGETIVAQAQRVLEEAARIRNLARAGQDQLAGELRLGAIFTVGPYLLPHVIPRLRRLAPAMPLVIEESFTAVLRDRLRRGELDAIIISLPFTEPGVNIWPLYDEPFLVLMPAGHRLARRAKVRREELAEENLLLLGAGHCFRDQVLEACPECLGGDPGSRLQNTTEGSSLETIRQMVASGLGLTVLPLTSMPAGGRRAERLTVARPFAGRAPKRAIALAWRRRFPRPQAIEILRRAILECHLPGVTYRDFEPPAEAAG